MRLSVMRPSGSSCSCSNATRLSLTAISRLLRAGTSQLGDDRSDDAGRGRCDGDDDGPLIGLRLLQRLELAVKQGRGHEVAGALGEALRDHRDLALEIDEGHARARPDDALA